jgi:hypothetical protein
VAPFLRTSIERHIYRKESPAKRAAHAVKMNKNGSRNKLAQQQRS